MKMGELLADTIYGCFEEVTKRSPHQPALVCLGEKITYSELLEMVLKFAASLYRLGVREEDRVILYLFNLPQAMITYLALQRIHAIPIPVAPVYTSYDLEYLATDSGVETIVCMDTNLNYVVEVLPKTPLKRIIVTNIVDLVPWWKKLIVRSFNRVPKGKIPSDQNSFSFIELLKSGNPSSLPRFVGKGAGKTALMLYTGGTTGFPKGVPLSTGLFLSRVREWRRASEAVSPQGKSISALAAPFYHIIGQMDAMAPLLVHGETLMLFPRVVLDALFDYIQQYKATNIFAVPAMYRMILEHDRVDYYDLSSLKFCGTGGDVLPVKIAERWLEKFKVPLYQAYGTTETCGVITASYAKDGIAPAGSIGRLIPDNKIKVVDPISLEPVPPGEAGELLVAPAYAKNYYWNKPEETAECFLSIEGEVWYRTRDIVRIDEKGWYYFMDRSVDMIKHKGYRIAAAEIEKVLQEHPTVLSSCVVGIPDEKVGERIKAFVVMKSDAKGASSYELMNWCRDRLAPYKVPHYIEFRDMLPKSKVGKMLRRELRMEERKKQEQV
jgi:long-chain acyl-CoA synthetase